MKTLNEKFTDAEMKRIQKIKKLTKLTWHDFIMKIVELSEVEIPRALQKEGKSEDEIKKIMGEKVK